MLKIVILLLIGLSSLSANDITGFWQTLDDNQQPSSVVAVYSYEGKYFARIIATYNDEGKLEDTMYHPIKKAKGVVGNPYYSGLDFVFVKPASRGNDYVGYVIDPRKGKKYDARMWRENEKVVLRGELFIFGKSMSWPAFPEEGFNKDFKKPDLSKFVPKIPELID